MLASSGDIVLSTAALKEAGLDVKSFTAEPVGKP